MAPSFRDLFPLPKPIIGMIHLSGKSSEKVSRALEELSIYDSEGVDGAIIEDYHGSQADVVAVLKESANMGLKLVRGVNVLRNPYMGLQYAAEHGARFVQFDSVQSKHLDRELYDKQRELYPEIAVLGGVRFKYTGDTGNPLEQDLAEARAICEAIVTTGEGTGMETPLSKLYEFGKILRTFPLVVGAGVNAVNVRDQLIATNGAIIGSYFKPNEDTREKVDRTRVRKIMDIVKGFRI